MLSVKNVNLGTHLFVFSVWKGSLIKVVYFSGNDCGSFEEQETSSSKGRLDVPNGNQNYCVLKGKLHFMKFETRKINDCIEFLSSKKFRCHGMCFTVINLSENYAVAIFLGI